MSRVKSLAVVFALLAGLLCLPAAGAETPSVNVGSGRYTVCFMPLQYGVQPDYDDFCIDVYSGDELIASCNDPRTEPVWGEKTFTFEAGEWTPTGISFSCMYRSLSTQPPFAVRCSRPFRAGVRETAEADDAYGARFNFASYIIEEIPSPKAYKDDSGVLRLRPDAVPVRPEMTELAGGWYYVSSTMTMNHRLKVTGSVNLILDDAAVLDCMEGIRLPSGSSLTLWGQRGGNFSLLADARGKNNCAGIGGDNNEDAGDFTMRCGSVRAYGGSNAAGIGGGGNGRGGKTVIRSGFVEANGKNTAAGIGGGKNRSGGEVTVYGGEVYASSVIYSASEQGPHGGAGIGGGQGGDQGGAVIIHGGVVYADGGYGGAGIGGGPYSGGGGDGGRVIIHGGEVHAHGGRWAAGIGGGSKGTNGEITINGGRVYAQSDMYTNEDFCETAAGIGAGDDRAQSAPITINGGVVSGMSVWGAGIGGSAYHDGGTIAIHGGAVTALSAWGAGIGGGGSKHGSGGSGGDVTITDGVVFAMSSQKGAGIGGGNGGAGGRVTITGGAVTAHGGYLDYNYIRECGILYKKIDGVMGDPTLVGLETEVFNIAGTLILQLVLSGEYGGAGIGGGSGGAGGIVNISGGTVKAHSGMVGASPIGSGKGGSSNGDLTLGDGMMVTKSGMPASGEDGFLGVPASERNAACRSDDFAGLLPCTHPGGSYQDLTWAAHRVQCSWCEAGIHAEEAHSFDGNTHRCACGHAAWPVTLRVTGGVCVGDGASFHIGGSASVCENVGGNVLLESDDAIIGITQPLSADARIGVGAVWNPAEEGARRRVTSGLAGRGDISAFFSDSGKYLLLEDAYETGEAALCYILPEVTFDGNSGTGEMGPDHPGIDTDYLLPECGFAAPEGMRFIGWWTPGAGVAVHAPGETIRIKGDVILTAVWDSPHTHDGEQLTPWSARDDLPVGKGAYYLLYDVRLDRAASWTIREDVTICLNSRTIDLNDKIITVNSGATLTLCDHGHHGKITGNTGRNEGICMDVMPRGTLALNGVTVTGNATDNENGLIAALGALRLNDAWIIGNRALGVKSAGRVAVAGDTRIAGNFRDSGAANLLLEEGAALDVAFPLADSAVIGVSASRAPQADAPVILTGPADEGKAARFVSDDPYYAVGLDDWSRMILGIPAALEFTVGEETAAMQAVCGGVFVLPGYDEYDDPASLIEGWRSGDALYRGGERITVKGNTAFTLSWKPNFGTPDLVLPAGTKAIGRDAFRNTAVHVAAVPSGCKTIGVGAFMECGNLTMIRVPAGCEIQEGAFDGCGKVYVFSAPGSRAEAYCDDSDHANCVFVAEASD